ncbi:MAG: TerC/Alx family metal homeostasis membrane protein, partial [Actinomycetes bacterium]
MNVSSLVWYSTILAFAAMFIAELLIVEIRRGKNKNSGQQKSVGHIFTNREAGAWIAFYVTAAIIFGTWLWISYGSEFGQQFFAGWLTEYSLSTDNVFVFAVIMSSFAVPDHLKHRVLEIGILLALILRSALIFLGAQAIHRFDAAFYVFSIFLFYLAFSVWRSEDSEPDPEGNGFVRWVAKRVPVGPWTKDSPLPNRDENGRRQITPFFLVIIAIGTTDLIFAIDSIPAVFGLTTETYIVVAVNAFALFGLRQIFFLLDGLLGKVRHLSRGLSAILFFIAAKMFIEAIDATTSIHIPEINIVVSLMVIVSILLATVLLSVREGNRLHGLRTLSEEKSEHIIEDAAGDALTDISDNDSVQDT